MIKSCKPRDIVFNLPDAASINIINDAGDSIEFIWRGHRYIVQKNMFTRTGFSVEVFKKYFSLEEERSRTDPLALEMEKEIALLVCEFLLKSNHSSNKSKMVEHIEFLSRLKDNGPSSVCG